MVVMRMAERDMNTNNNKSTIRTSAIERWLRHGDLGNSPPVNGVVSPPPPPRGSFFNPLRRRNDDRLARGSPSSSSNGETSSSPNHLCFNASNDPGLSESFYRMTIGGVRQEERTETRRAFGSVDRDNHGYGFGLGFGLDHENSTGAYNDNDVRSSWLGFGLGCSSYNNVGDSIDSIGSPLTYTTRSSRNSSPTFGYNNKNGQMSNFYSVEVQYQNPIGGPYLSDDPVSSHPNQHYFARGTGRGGLFGPSLRANANTNMNMNSPIRERSAMRERTGVTNSHHHHHHHHHHPRVGVNPVLISNHSFKDYEGFDCEDSFIIEGTSLSPVIKDGPTYPNARNIGHYPNGWDEIGYLQMLVLENFRAMAAQEGFVYLMAKDQSGCRNLQKVFEEGTREDVDTIFENVIDHVVELSTDPFGNYLVQKLLEVCLEEQRRRIVFAMAKNPGDLLRVSLNTHGTRVVQKLIETARHWRSISLLKKALKPCILDLIKDLNGNHVLQTWLKCLSVEDNVFVFDAVTRFCVEIATHRHGCCVMQKCIEHATDYHKLELVTEILKHAVLLAADPYGNYVIQFIMDQKIQYGIIQMASRFKGNYVHLSTLKCGSHVVEKCLKELPETREVVVNELLQYSQFDKLLQDPYANYVIQSALKSTKGHLHKALVDTVRAHNNTLRASPYCKKILTQAMSKK